MKRKQFPIPRSFVKWVGGKKSSVDAIVSRMPEKIDTYYEPMFGGGAVFFALCRAGRIKNAVIGDTNHELSATLFAIRNDVEEIITALETLSVRPVTEDLFLHIRKLSPVSDVAVAVRMIFLNKTCFNGLYRVNKKAGKFNTSWGKVEKFTFDADNLRAVSEALQCARITNSSFESLRGVRGKRSVVYLDPPYFPVSKTASFTAYTQDNFKLSDQIQLASTFAELAENKVCVLASNADVPQARALYGMIPGVEAIELKRSRRINSDATKRGKVGELLFVANGRK